MKNFKIKIFNFFNDELKNLWLEFETRSFHHIFQTYDWQKLWLEKQIEYNNKIINFTVFIYEKDELIMILPLNIKEYYKIKILAWSGFPFSDYNSPLIKNHKKLLKENFEDLWNNILSKLVNVDCIVLNNQPENILSQKNPFYNYLKNDLIDEYYGIKLDQNLEFKKKELDNINYQTNILKNLGELSFKIAENDYEKKEIIDFIIQNKSKQYDNTKAWNLFKDNFCKDFFISSNLKIKKKIFITYLKLNNDILAAHSGYIYNNMCYYLFPAYNLKYKKYSPGKILLKKIIDQTKSNLVKYFDLTIGSENYKKSFANNKSYSAQFLKSLSLKGSFYISLLKIKFFLKKILKGQIF